MRKKDKEVTSQTWMEGVLNETQWLELGLSGIDGWPYIAPMNFAYKDGYLILHGAKQGKKAEMLHENSKVCFQAITGTEVIRNEENPSAFSMKYRSVTGFGIAKVLEEEEEKREAMKELMRRYNGPLEPIPDTMLEKTLVVKVEITEMTGKISGYQKPE